MGVCIINKNSTYCFEYLKDDVSLHTESPKCCSREEEKKWYRLIYVDYSTIGVLVPF